MLNYKRRFFEHFGVCSSGFSLLPARFQAIMRIAVFDIITVFTILSSESEYKKDRSSMNFFDQQARARRTSAVLVLLYILAMGVSLGLAYLASLWGAAVYRSIYNGIRAHYDIQGTFTPQPGSGLWNVRIFGMVSAVGLIVMVGATWRRLHFMGAGGKTMTALLGGTPVDIRARDTAEKRLLNIVEEMAIASGLAIPVVYVLRREPGINAFSAGISSDDTVITVTQGALETLTRDELQALVAHEFCHILYGDTYVKTLMAGVLHGIMMPWHMIRGSLMGAVYGRSFFPLPILLGAVVVTGVVSIPFIVVTQIGAIMAAFIKRHVSVQREYLADAAAVQFTRNGEALASVLKKIGGYMAGSRILSPEHDYASHFFFASPVGSGMLNWAWLTTHPPLLKRIRRLDPQFDGEYARVASGQTMHPKYLPKTISAETVPEAAAEQSPLRASLAEVGTAERQNLDAAAHVLSELPQEVQACAREPLLAPAIVYAFLLSQDGAIRQQQRKRLAHTAAPETLDALDVLSSVITESQHEPLMPAIKLAARSLKELSAGDHAKFMNNVEAMIAADGRISLIEATVRQAILQHAAHSASHQQTAPGQRMKSSDFVRTCQELLACLAYWGTYDIAEEEEAYKTGMREVVGPDSEPPAILAARTCTQTLFTSALQKLATLPTSRKKCVMQACYACIASNNKTTDDEVRLFRSIADALQCPMPPLP